MHTSSTRRRRPGLRALASSSTRSLRGTTRTTTRRTESGSVVSDREAVSREEALRMMTSAAARFSFDEKDRGSIEPGKLGDFVVLDEDMLKCPPERLPSIRADLTVVGGHVAFE